MKKPTKLTLLLWAYGMPGVIAMLSYLPVLLRHQKSSLPLPILCLISFLQSTMLVLFSAWLGSRCAPRVGLKAPMAIAIIEKSNLWTALRPQLVPGIAGGILGFAIFLSAAAFTPSLLQNTDAMDATPILVKLLYGGISEEILLRWGIMSFFAALLWRFTEQEKLKPLIFWISIIMSALLFAVGHLPATLALTGGHLSVPLIGYIMIFNSAFGLIAGFLFWSFGLEAAIIAHMLAHGLFELFF